MLSVKDYQLGQVLYEGTDTIVYRGEHLPEKRPVVVKFLRHTFLKTPKSARFRLEYEMARTLNVDGVPKVHELIEHEYGLGYSMDDVGGVSLAQHLQSATFSVPAFLEVAGVLTETIGALHARGIVHRDVNPANVVYNAESGRVQLIDFGLSTILSREQSAYEGADVLEGTLAYMSPEQTGRMNRDVDYRSDFYSLGATFYHMLAGRPPFSAPDAMGLVHAHIALEPERVDAIRPELPQVIGDIVAKLMAKTAEDRYQSAKGISADLSACLKQLRDTGFVESFTVGLHDTTGHFQIPQKLYGRSEEVDRLVEAFEKACSGSSEVMLMVVGQGGIGKSALVQEMYKPVVRNHAYFTSGKFDQLQRTTPYSALIQAFQELIRQILTEKEERISRWRERLLDALGPNGRVVLDVIPELRLIIGEQPDIPPLGPAEGQNRFTLVFRRFIGALATQEQPLVVFLDDLQWADSATLDLMKSLVTDPDSRHTFFIGAYRDADVDEAHPLSQTLAGIRKEGREISQLTLGPLALAHVTELVADTLAAAPKDVQPLAEVVHKLTLGNPFFVNQLLRTLFEERLIVFDQASSRWTWDLEAILAKGFTDNVVDLMAGRIQKLSGETQRTLQLAACIGSRFDLASLSKVRAASMIDTAVMLWDALVEGLVTPVDDSYRYFQAMLSEHLSTGDGISDEPDGLNATYRFLHDRVQQAAYALLPEADRPRTHLAIGRLLAEARGPDADVDFSVVEHLNLGSALIEAESERLALAQLNLRAGRKAKAAAAYSTALKYYEAGLTLLPHESWSRFYELTLGLHTDAAEAAYLATDYDKTERLAAEVLANATTLLDRARIFEVRIQSSTAQHNMLDAVSRAAEILKEFDISLPLSPSNADILRGYLSTKLALAGKRIRDLKDLPEMTEPRKLAAMKLLQEAGVPVYYGTPMLFPLLVFHTVKLSIRHGNTPSSAFAYAMYGTLLAGFFGDIRRAAQFGELAMRVNERFHAVEQKSKVHMVNFTGVYPWTHPIRDSLPKLLEGTRSGLETGDFEYAALNSSTYCNYSFFAGADLDQLLDEMRIYASVIDKIRQPAHGHSLAVFHQVVLNLSGNAEDPRILEGEACSQSEIMPVLSAANNRTTLGMVHIGRAMLCYMFGDFRAAIEEAERAAEFMVGVMYTPINQAYLTLSLLAASAGVDGMERRKLLRRARGGEKKFRKWARFAPDNFQHILDLIRAERAGLTGKFDLAAGLYDKAVSDARSAGFRQFEAIASERAGLFYLRRDKTRMASNYLLDAKQAYSLWGAHRKVLDLDERHGTLIALPESNRTRRQGSTEVTDVLDLNTVLKAAQAISGEIVLSKLLSKLMRIVMENAGAHRGLLVLEEKGTLIVEAEATAGIDEVMLHQATPIEEHENISTGIANYTARTLDYVVLGDAVKEERFANDPYVISNKPKSVLCMPLLNRGTLTGILYLENNLTTGAFTPDRLEVLQLLSGEIAISIENARLYNNLEQKVEERTEELRKRNSELNKAYRDLRATQSQLIHAEKMASLGQLTAGIAHEIKNPLNFVNNFSKLISEIVEELGEFVGDNPEKTIKDAARELDEVIQDLSSAAEQVQKHGKRADSIISGMMQHARATPGHLQPVKVNSLLDEYVTLAYHGIRASQSAVEVTIDRQYDEAIGEVTVIPQDLGRVFINLLNNAYFAVAERAGKEVGDYRPTVTVTTKDLGQRVEITIGDNGTGIPEDIRTRIFEPFFTTKPTGEGTGLGLSLSYDIIVQAHEGELEVQTEEGKGSTFVIRIPKRADDSQSNT